MVEEKNILEVLEYLKVLFGSEITLKELIKKYRKTYMLKKGDDRIRSYKKWSEKEINYLKKNFGKKTLKEMAEELGKSYDSVRGMVYNTLKLQHKK